MTPTYRQVTATFFSLLRSGLYGTPIPEAELPAAIEWDAVIDLAKKHAVLGVIIESVQFLPTHLRPSAALLAKMQKYALKLIKSNIGLDKAVGRVVEFFQSHGIQGVLLKGQGVARSYRVPQMRVTGDIDFYVGEPPYKEAVALCHRYLINGNDYGKESTQHFPFKTEGITVELHRIATEIYSPFRRRAFQQWIIEELEHSPHRRVLPIGGVDVTLPSLDFDTIYIYYHAMRHFTLGGIGLRQLSDWAMLFHTHADELNLERIAANVRRFGLTRGWKLFAIIAVEYLGVAPEKMPLYDPAMRPTAEKLLDAIVSGGNFGWYAAVNASDPSPEYNFRYAVAKFRYMFSYFIYSFPIMPLESTCWYIYRMYSAISSGAKMTLRRILHKR